MKTFSSIILLVCLVVVSYGQNQELGTKFETNNESISDLFKIVKAVNFGADGAQQTVDLRNVEGSPYLDEEFVKGELVTTAGKKYENVMLRYNAFNDNMEYKGPQDKIFQIGVPEIIKEINIGSESFIYTSYQQSKKKVEKGFFQRLNQDKIALLKKYVIKYEEPIKATAYGEAQPAKFINGTNVYYLQNNSACAVPVNSTKNILTAFSDKESEIESFINKEKLDIKEESDLLKIIEYYSSLNQ